MSSLTYEVSNEYISALRDTDTEKIDKHDHIVTIGTCCQGFITDLVDEVSDDYLRKTVRDVLAHGWDTDEKQIL